MKTKEQIKWLKRFIELWDKNVESHGERHLKTLTSIYQSFLKKETLDKLSADELMFELQQF